MSFMDVTGGGPMGINPNGWMVNNPTIAVPTPPPSNPYNLDPLGSKGPSSGYGTVGGYPTFGDPAPAGTYSPGTGLSSFSGTPLGGSANPSGTVTRGPDLPDLSFDPFGSGNPYDGGVDPASGGGIGDIWSSPGGGQDNYYYSGNYFGADTNPDAGMAPGMGGFNNPNYTTMQFDPPNKSAVPGDANAYNRWAFGGDADMDWYKGGSQGARPSTLADTNNLWGGQYDQDWVKGGSLGARPSTVAGWGGRDDLAWMMSGSQGARPSTLADPTNLWGGAYDQDWVQGGSQGARPSMVADWGGAEDQAWVQGGSQGDRPSLIPTLNAGWADTNAYASDDDAYAWSSQNRTPGSGNDTTLANQRTFYADKARSDPNYMFKMAAKAMQEDQNSSEGRTAVIEAMLNRWNATKQEPLNPSYYPKNKAAYNAEIEQRLRNNPQLLASVIQDVERAFGGSNLANYGTNWSSGNTWLNDKKYVTPTKEQGANNFYIKNLTTPDATGRSWAGEGIAKNNQAWWESVTGVPPH